LYCIVLYCIVLYYIVLYYIVLIHRHKLNDENIYNILDQIGIIIDNNGHYTMDKYDFEEFVDYLSNDSNNNNNNN
jgi:hypothetical protein